MTFKKRITHRSSTCVLLTLLLLPVSLLAQTTHTWVRDSVFSPDIWSWAENWDTANVPVNGDSLIFDGDYAISSNDLTNLLLHRITFAQTMGAPAELYGNPMHVGGVIENASKQDVYVEADIVIAGGGGAIPYSWLGTQEGVIFNIGSGGMTIGGNVSSDNISRVFAKEGSGVLTLLGNNQTYFTMIRQGTVIVDGGTLGKVGTEWQRRLTLGTNPGADSPQNMHSGKLILRNGASADFGTIEMFAYAGASSIVLESGATLVTGGISVNNTSYSEGVGSSMSTLNINIAEGGSLTYGTATGYIAPWATVTEKVGGVNKTGMSYRDEGVLTRSTDYALSYTGGDALWGSRENDYLVTGDVVASATVWMRTMILTGSEGGDVTGAPTGTFNVIAFMMEEGTGDYVIDKRWGGTDNGQSSPRYVHQYSTSGVLTFTRDFTTGSGANQQHFVKTGPGTVVFASGAVSSLTSQTEIQGGRFVLDGVFGQTSHFRVRGEDAILSGQGSIGGQGTTPVYTKVTVFEGGTLEGNYHEAKALDITGSLTIFEDGQYLVNLKPGSTYDPLTVRGTADTSAVVSLAGNLILTLDYAYAGGGPIILLLTDGIIQGAFDTINGVSFIDGKLFSLAYDTEEYWFEIDYQYAGVDGYTAVALLSMIPEPSTVVLLTGIGLIGLIYMRRRRSV
jgi:hypothetical protein